MKIAGLVFDQQGCCGSHKWAVAKHDNGKVSTVYDNTDGTYDIVTHGAGLLLRGQEHYADEASANVRLAEDAS